MFYFRFPVIEDRLTRYTTQDVQTYVVYKPSAVIDLGTKLIVKWKVYNKFFYTRIFTQVDTPICLI